MLRILVISLFVANLLLLGFQDNEPEVKPEIRVNPTTQKDTGIPTIHLFSEMIEDQGLLSGSRRCFSLGPFHSIEDRDETHTRLMEVTASISERETQALVEKGYWVFMPPYASLLVANQELLSLQALGLKDIGVIYDGDWKNAISLGYFLRQENAVRRKKSLEDKGYAPLMRVQRQSEPRYWLDYEQNPGSELIALDMQNRPNDFMQRSLPCPQEDPFELTDTAEQESTQVMAQRQAPQENGEQANGPVEADDAALETIPGQDAASNAEEENTPDLGQDAVFNKAVEIEPASDPAEDLNTPEENLPDPGADPSAAEAVVPSPVEDLDTNEGLSDEPPDGAEDPPEQAIETEPGSAEDPPEQAIDTEPGSAEDPSGQAIETGQEEVEGPPE